MHPVLLKQRRNMIIRGDDMSVIKDRAEACYDEIVGLRRQIHRHPEIGRNEFVTSALIREKLAEYGVDKIESPVPTAVVALIHGKKGPGRCVALRADIDALPVQEETGLPFASEVPNMMHACGHDCHTAAMLTAARVLNDHKDELCGTVKLAFQPAEEVAMGAKSMIEQGAMDGVDACFGIHVWSDVAAGKVSLEAGPRMAAADQFIINVHGRGGHGSAPHQCIDTAVVTSAIVQNLQTIVSREINPADAAVLTVGKIEAGSRWNVIAEYGTLEGTTRYYNPDFTALFEEAIGRVAAQTAASYRAEAKLDYLHLIAPTVNEPAFTELATKSAKKALGEDCLYHQPAVTGGEDFSFFLEKAPGAIAFMGVRNEAKGACWAQHHCKYDVDEDALINSVKLYVQVALDFNAGC